MLRGRVKAPLEGSWLRAAQTEGWPREHNLPPIHPSPPAAELPSRGATRRGGFYIRPFCLSPADGLTKSTQMVIIITVLKQTICEVSHLIPVLAFVQHYKKFYTSQFEAAAARHGLNQLEIDILLFLHNNPDCRTASDICRYRGLAKSNVSKAVEHLRVMDLVTVSPAADNRRQRMLGFTQQAAMLVEELAAIQQAAAAAVAADLTPAEWQAMQDYIARMDATLRRRLAEKGENV